MRLKTALFATAGLALALPGVARADEGMWTFDAFPAARMKQTYGWAPDQAIGSVGTWIADRKASWLIAE